MNPRTLAHLQIHTAVLLFGLTGILGDLIDLPKSTLVWWRMGLTALSLLVLPRLVKRVREIPKKDRWRMFGIGMLVAVHWVTFFGAIALTNVSVTLACLATTSFFTAILEPILLGTRMKWYELMLGILVVPGVALIYQSSDFAFSGILVALSSAVLAATFSILNKKLVARHDAIAMTFLELGSGFIGLCVVLPFFYGFSPESGFFPQGIDWLWLAILTFGCTSFAYVISLRALRELSTFTVNLTINLEPVYTIVLAFFLLNEHQELGPGFYVGASVIILAVASYPLLNRFFNKSPKSST